MFFLACVLFVLSSCKEKAVSLSKDVYYTCSMHPQVIADHPGACPICGMTLIAVPKSTTNVSTQVRLSREQIKLGNIQVDTIETGNIGNKVIYAGTLNFNLDKLSSISARADGRIERLFFKNTGDYVHKGDKLFDLYSESLNNAKQEYITALEQQAALGNSVINYAALVESTKHKLALLGMTGEQIKQLAATQQASTLTSFFSAEEGYVTTLDVKEGDYVPEGGTIMQLANLTTLWAEAQVYTTQMSALNKIGDVSVQIPELGKEGIPGKIDFVNPEINPETRINLVRVTIPNKNNQLHPGMPVYIRGNASSHNSITLPSDAVLTDSKGSTVWVQSQPGIYEARMVKTGIDDGNAIEILSGLQTGDVVVISGAYLINSEYIFEHGTSPMQGMKMSNMKM